VVTVRQASAIAQKQIEQRDMHWPGAEGWLWNRKANKGFTTIPKTLPMIMKIMDEMTKGAPVSSAYLALWCNTWDNAYVVINRQTEDALALSSGFGGQRGVHTWQGRMKRLQELRFIDIKPGKSGPMSNVIIWNPHYVLRWHRQQKTLGLMDASYVALLDLALEVGARDMTGPEIVPEPGSVPLAAPVELEVGPAEVSA
jgi:hypothetical protein